jgi:ABC-type dipeptide/oligopeptide/nickel transport system permease component
MLPFLVRRLAYSVFVVFGVATAVFVVLRLLPADPVYTLAGPTATVDEVDAMRHALGFDRPLYVQYAIFLRDMLSGDFGKSVYQNNVPALDLVLERMPATLELVAPSLVLAVIAAFALGALAATRPGSWLDELLSVVALAGQSAPSFWIGPVLILVFARELGWLPTSGRGGLAELVMPVVTMSLPLFAVSMRLVRSGVLETRNRDFVRTARAKGLRESIVLRRHVYPNMLIPVITFIGLQLGHLLSGSVIVETVFAWPGVGRLLVDSITNRDYTVVQASVIVFAGLFILVNLLVDLLYGLIDPRVGFA